jgi:hypothetical protein
MATVFRDIAAEPVSPTHSFLSKAITFAKLPLLSLHSSHDIAPGSHCTNLVCKFEIVASTEFRTEVISAVFWSTVAFGVVL